VLLDLLDRMKLVGEHADDLRVHRLRDGLRLTAADLARRVVEEGLADNRLGVREGVGDVPRCRLRRDGAS
jgi:hypothetical protein